MKLTETSEHVKSQKNVKKTDKQHFSKIKSEDFEIIEIKDNPFVVIRENKIYFVAFGNQRVSGKFMNKAEAIKDANRTDLTRITQLIIAINNINNK